MFCNNNNIIEMSSFLLKIMTLATYRCDVGGGLALGGPAHRRVLGPSVTLSRFLRPYFALAIPSRPLPEPFVRHGISVQGTEEKM